jgi:LacI family transcriptional regulator
MSPRESEKSPPKSLKVRPKSQPAPLGKRTPTLKDIAAHVGVSQATVSAILNEAPTASNFADNTRREVKEAAQLLGYRINPLARALRRVRSGVLGCILYNHFDVYYSRVSEVAESYAKERGYELVVVSMGYDLKRLEACLSHMAAWRVEGILLMLGGRPLSPDILAMLDRINPPFVIGDSEDSGSQGSVSRFTRRSGELVAEHLWSLGHRNVAIVGENPNNLHSRERVRGVEEYFQAQGAVLEPRLRIPVPTGAHGPNAGYLCTREALQSGLKFSAIICMNDLFAFGSLAALREKGVKVPEQCSVTGFDDPPLDLDGTEVNRLSRYAAPPLTTVRLPMREICREAMRRLICKVEASEEEAAYSVEQQPRLIVRESTCPPGKMRA